MSLDPPVTGTGVSVVAHGTQSLVFYQSLDGRINQNRNTDNAWIKERLKVRPVCGSPLASVTYDSGKEVSGPRISR
jgi:hypothetical protein